MTLPTHIRGHHGARRRLRIVKNTPIALATCEFCKSLFSSRQPLEDDAEAEMKNAFDRHECSGEES